MGPVEKTINDKLNKAFSPIRLIVKNQSHLHSGHASSPGTGESHFLVDITCSAFEGKNRVACQRLVMDALKEELAGPIHALSIKTSAH